MSIDHHVSHQPTPSPGETGAPWGAAVVEHLSGPAIGAAVTLPPGRHVVGRSSSCAIRVADGDAEPHHVMLDVADDGHVAALQLTGRLPVLAAGAPLTGRTCAAPGTVVDVGASRIRIAAPGAHRPVRAPRRLHDGNVVVRPPRPSRREPNLTIEAPPRLPDRGAPSEGSAAGPVVASVLGIAGALALAIVVGQPLFALFAVTGGVATVGTWLAGRLRARRHRRRADRLATASVDRFARDLDAMAAAGRAHHEVVAPTVGRVIEERWTDALWSCRAAHGDAFTVSVGTGDMHVPIAVTTPDGAPLGRELAAMVERARCVEDATTTVALDRSRVEVVAVTGPLAVEVVRAIIAQLAVRTGPADWRLAVVCRDRVEHEWMVRLPHAQSSPVGSIIDADDPAELAAGLIRLDDGDERRTVVVTDAPGLLANRTSPLRRLLDTAHASTVLVASMDDASVPASCTAALETGPRSTGRWQPALAAGGTTVDVFDIRRIRIAGIDRCTAESIAASLEGLVDPEDPSAAAGRLPARVDLAELAGAGSTNTSDVASPFAVRDSWAQGGADPAAAAVVGVSADGPVEIDLVRDGPHGLIAGTTGSGKSELLRTLVVALAARLSPEHLSFVLVDYKGGATFDACAGLPHVVGVVTDLDDGLAERALVSLEAELHRRERLLRERRASDLAEYRAVGGSEPLARLVVIVDEFAALAGELPGFVPALVGIAQRGRSLGVHLLLATQRPAGVVDDAIRANTDLRVALRLNDDADALDVVGSTAPARFARGVPGRALVRLGHAELIELQTAACSNTTISAIAEAAASAGIVSPHRPWLPPLTEIGIDDVPICDTDQPTARDVIGVIDDPAGQRRLPLRWDRTGNLALVGALGSGTTSTLVALGRGALADPGTQVYVLDSRGDPALAVLESSDRCAGVIGVDDRERVTRVLSRLCDEIEQRRAARAGVASDRVLLIDGVLALRRSLDEIGLGETATALDRLLAEGPAVGVVVAAVLEAGGGGSAALLSRFSERWVFHLDDPADALTLGVRARPGRVGGGRPIGAGISGPGGGRSIVPGRLMVAASGLEAQVLSGLPAADGARAAESTEPVVPIGSLPAIVPADAVVPPPVDGRDLRLAVGIDYDSLESAVIEIPAGEHVLVVGPARSGRTTALARIAAAWSSAHPDGRVVHLDRSAASFDALARAVEGTTGAERAVDAERDRSIVEQHPPLLVVVDDAERVDDRDGQLAALVESGQDHVLVIAAGRPEPLRSSFGHWTASVRRSRLGMVMASGTDLDGDVIGAAIPRRCPIAPRPGLAWASDGSGVRLVQLATDQSSNEKPRR